MSMKRKCCWLILNPVNQSDTHTHITHTMQIAKSPVALVWSADDDVDLLVSYLFNLVLFHKTTQRLTVINTAGNFCIIILH